MLPLGIMAVTGFKHPCKVHQFLKNWEDAIEMLTIYNRLNEGKETQSIIARMSIDIYIIYSMQSLNIYSFN